jgi:alpha-2-macroglobulin
VELLKLLPRYKKLKPLPLAFGVTGREIQSLNADFELLKKDNPNNVTYKGTLSVTEAMDIKLVKKAVRFKDDSKNIPLTWHMKKNDKVFSFSSKPLKRTTKTRYFFFKIDKKAAQLSSQFNKVIELAPLKELKITGFRKFDQGERPGIELIFSDELNPRQDKTGLIRVVRDKAVADSKSFIETSIKTMKKSIYIEGDFVYGKSFTIKVSGIQSKWGTGLKQEYEKEFNFEDKKPELSFMSSGIFLPSSNQQKIRFKTINLKQVQVEIKKVFESNLGQFLQTEKISSRMNRNVGFNYQYVHRVGVSMVYQTLAIGETRNQWLTHEMDLKKLIEPGEKGLFLIRLYFNHSDMLYEGLNKEKRYYYGKEYYSNPNSHGYIQRHGSIYKPIVISDIGLLVKKGGNRRHMVFATDIIDASPMSKVKVTLRTFQNQVIASTYTDNDGKALFSKVNRNVFYIEAEKNGQRSFVQPKEMAWNISSFDTGGQEDTGNYTRAFIYTDRGVYRPGDGINLSVIARNWNNAFPENHPVTLKVYNPKNQLIYEKKNKTGNDGFYSFYFKTKGEDMTGNWRAVVQAGSRQFYQTLKIETIAPYRLKVKIEPGQKQYSSDDESLAFKINSNYLFGSPAASLKAKVTLTLQHRLQRFSRFPGFQFNNEAVSFKPVWHNVFDDLLDDLGHADLNWSFPDLDAAPSSLEVQITAKVFEKGGRATRNDRIILVHPFSNYIGLQKPKNRVKTGARVSIPTILVNRKGEPVADRRLKYKVYQNTRYWWWEYDNHRDFRVRYKKDHYTRSIKEGFVTTKKSPTTIEFMPESYGEFLVEVEEADRVGHKAGFFFRSRYYGSMPGDSGNDKIGTLSLRSDKPIYNPGEKAAIRFPNPGKGTVLVTLEKNNKVLRSWVYDSNDLEKDAATGKNMQGQLRIYLPVTKDLVPNAYVSVAIIQPHSQTGNDRPIRMYGILPLMVKDPDTAHELKISMLDQLKSSSDFDIEVSTTDGNPTQFTIAIVDEGLLDITGFETPNPWQHFFRKQRLGVKTFDLFPYVIGAHKGDIFRLFSIGGDIDNGESYRSSQMDANKSKRFKPVALFKGPITTDEKGIAKVSFKMPDYIGSVRVMVISTRGGSYGRTQKTVPVKTDLMVLPKLPRVLSPGDRLQVPVTVFSMNEKIRSAKVSLQFSGPIEIEGDSSRVVAFEKPGEQNVMFSLQVPQAVGEAVITVKAESPQMTVQKSVEISVRPSSPRVYDSKTYGCKPGHGMEIPVPKIGLPGSNHATIKIVCRPNLNLNHRLQWLIRYPYGCIEQTTSSVFPQLYLKVLLKKSKTNQQQIDRNIDAGIARLRRFLTFSGGLAYWPGGSQANAWGTNYGSHFLIEAKRLGYHVPLDMYSRLLRYQKSRALTEKGNLKERSYRLYLLALAGNAEIGAMNLIKENQLKKMSNTSKWMLASAYHLAGRKGIAKSILATAGTKVNEYMELSGTFGSGLRDKAIILEMATLGEDWSVVTLLFEDIVKQVSGGNWYSTQTLGYSLLAIGKYLHVTEINNQSKPIMKGYIKLPGDERVEFETDQLQKVLASDEAIGRGAEIYLTKDSSHAYALVEWNGVPLEPEIKDESKNLNLKVSWLDELGDTIDPSELKQGTTFWAHFRVSATGYHRNRVEELALVHLLPSGWEIENTRLLKEEKPAWMKDWNLNREEYLDIRDDRVMWFFDMNRGETLDFVVKLNAVAVGHFTLPPILFEAMYDNRLKAVRKGRKIEVLK